MSSRDAPSRVLVLNPNSGSADHGEQVHQLAADRDVDVRVSERSGEAAAIAAHAAAQGADLVAAAGGDGTVNEVVLGLHQSGHLSTVTFAVVPCGTGNNFADNVGVEGIEHAFELLERGDRRSLDVGLAFEAERDHSQPFVNSCVGGVTAEASERTDPESKSRFGSVAYAVSAIQTLADFEGMELSVDPAGGGEPWSGTAALVFVGNARGIPGDGRAQANVEDGLFEVAIVEDRPTTELASDAAAQQLFQGDADSVVRMLAPELEVRIHDASERPFSLDGEMVETDRLRLGTRPGALEVIVGEAYEPEPDRNVTG